MNAQDEDLRTILLRLSAQDFLVCDGDAARSATGADFET
jgi:hypothetical protein